MCVEREHGCQHSCISTPGSFYCECNPGYRLNVDGKTCSRKNPFYYLNFHRELVVMGLVEGSWNMAEDLGSPAAAWVLCSLGPLPPRSVMIADIQHCQILATSLRGTLGTRGHNQLPMR